ncbi:protein ALTERED XYLOGLUCAN 4 [Macadamia integrifolia]|uniref:protein ALTERED XYLOGLUCAN 4 n=1 Tax=Macadamia integrifolia TaxID=60698 RepID=UPI001C4F4832|nr:protein ALTERED XYLOGLUCAN 4 [Macadamia integrifolia]
MRMGSPNSLKDQPRSFTKLRSWALYILFPLTLLHLYFYPLHLTPSLSNQAPPHKPVILSAQVLKRGGPFHGKEISCDYFNGKWVRDKAGPLYNGTSCSTIKEGQNCLNHGRPDKGYLFWRWKPKQCRLPMFEPFTFLSLLENKHVAFVGDSMARNQLESLVCLLSSVSSPDLVYRSGDDNKFRRWHFPSHNLNISIYWSPFLVKGIEKSDNGFDHNKLYLDTVDERWASELGQIDMLVLSVGHWFLHPAVYYEKELVLGCHYCPGLNHTEIGFYDVYRKAFNTTLKAIIDRRGGDAMDVIVTTFSPSHFEGEWDKAGACPKKKPFMEGEKAVEGMDAEMRKIGVEELEGAIGMKKELEMATGKTTGMRLQALDVTKLALMRPDGHPGPYMHPFPFANGVPERVQNDCVHWCLPGPIDTWNEILLEVIRRWEVHSRYGSKMKIGRRL